MNTEWKLYDRWIEHFGESRGVFKLIVEAYTHKRRYYHNLEHLDFMFDALDKHFPNESKNKALVLAIFFHDFVYCSAPL